MWLRWLSVAAFSAFSAGAIAGPGPDHNTQAAGANDFPAWPQYVQLLERSYVRCLRQQFAANGYTLTRQQEESAVFFERDVWGLTLLPIDIASAPTEREGTITFIRCSWFSD